MYRKGNSATREENESIMEIIAHGAHQHYEIMATGDRIHVVLTWNKSGHMARMWSYRVQGLDIVTIGKAPWIPPMSELDRRLSQLKAEMLEGQGTLA